VWTPATGVDHAGAMREFAAAISAQPSLNEVHHWMGVLLLHLSMIESTKQECDRYVVVYRELTAGSR
jgi:hypothetical protein